MRNTNTILVALLFFGLQIAASQPYSSQVHISLTLYVDEMTVTWSTPEPTDSWVDFGEARSFPDRVDRAFGSSEVFVDNGTLHHTQYIHRVVLAGLKPLTHYVYHIWNVTDYSPLFHFTSVGGSDWAPRFTIYGDFGLVNSRSLEHLVEETHAAVSDIIVHVGDFAYDMFDDNATRGDIWLDSVQEVASSQPYMVCPGNHEGMYDFLNYRSRFSMPSRNESENLYFAWNAGLTHWIAYDTEVYFVYEAMAGHGGVHRNFGPYPEVAKAQLAFVEADLIAANANRHNQPWIIVYGHRPMYCSDNDDDDCVQMRNLWKNDLEQLFYKYGVDLVIEAHQHSYERLWPVFNGTVLNGSTEYPYTNARAPIHIVSGSAGCQENLDTFGPPLGPWSALRVSEYGYAHLTVINETHMHWEQLRSDEYTIVDEIWIVKDSIMPRFATYEPPSSTPAPSPLVSNATHDNTATTTHTEKKELETDLAGDLIPSQHTITTTTTTPTPETLGRNGFFSTLMVVCSVSTLIAFVVYWSKWFLTQRKCANDDKGMYHRI